MTHTVKTITVGYVTLELPTGMPSKEIQQLAGYLATLRKIDSHLLDTEGKYRTVRFVESSGPTITLDEIEVETQEEADRLKEENNATRKAKATAA